MKVYRSSAGGSLIALEDATVAALLGDVAAVDAASLLTPAIHMRTLVALAGLLRALYPEAAGEPVAPTPPAASAEPPYTCRCDPPKATQVNFECRPPRCAGCGRQIGSAR